MPSAAEITAPISAMPASSAATAGLCLTARTSTYWASQLTAAAAASTAREAIAPRSHPAARYRARGIRALRTGLAAAGVGASARSGMTCPCGRVGVRWRGRGQALEWGPRGGRWWQCRVIGWLLTSSRLTSAYKILSIYDKTVRR